MKSGSLLKNVMTFDKVMCLLGAGAFSDLVVYDTLIWCYEMIRGFDEVVSMDCNTV